MLKEEKKWYDGFIDMLYQKFPKKQSLVQELIDLLVIEREAVYRRLRREVMFSAHEIAIIANAWDISLDNVMNINSNTIAFHLRKMNYINPTEEEVIFLNKVIQGIQYAKNFPTTEFMDVCNKLPRQLVASFEHLNQFYLFKWLFQYSKEKDILPFSKVVISEEKAKVTQEYNQAIRTVPNSSFIFDRLLFDNLVSDIQYFYSIRMLSDEEKELIKRDLIALLNYLQEIANVGCYPDTQNKVNLYVSHLYVDTNYNYVYTPEVNICFVHVFEKFELFTYHSEMAANFRSWMQIKKRSSMLISEVDERSRIEFFSKQRRLIDSL